MVVELGDLQKIHPCDQAGSQQPDQYRTGDQTLVDQPRLFFVVFQGDWIGHFYSFSVKGKQHK
ncbi:hypothetical protein KPSA1_04300 [Pseudomonas syringae pv. actinidiae]|uniref:Uncharacterized protein n=1 Tax=Pseudomonas syringae pv. actinidiae TaxID=103796 RepID=A0A2V0QCI3_PSESF|nr:hypothetical protein KPSA1_04300 [Pseudomonas syringae pv. actinidiae]